MDIKVNNNSNKKIEIINNIIDELKELNFNIIQRIFNENKMLQKCK